jgi:hypothetical protein
MRRVVQRRAGGHPRVVSIGSGVGGSGRQRSTMITSYWSAVGGIPVSNLAFTAASRSPKRATVAGTWKRSLVTSLSTVPDVRFRAEPHHGYLVEEVLDRVQLVALEQDAVDERDAHAGNRAARAGRRVDDVQRALAAVRDDQRLAGRRGLDAVVVELPAGVRRRSAELQRARRPERSAPADRDEVEAGPARSP